MMFMPNFFNMSINIYPVLKKWMYTVFCGCKYAVDLEPCNMDFYQTRTNQISAK